MAIFCRRVKIGSANILSLDETGNASVCTNVNLLMFCNIIHSPLPEKEKVKKIP